MLRTCEKIIKFKTVLWPFPLARRTNFNKEHWNAAVRPCPIRYQLRKKSSIRPQEQSMITICLKMLLSLIILEETVFQVANPAPPFARLWFCKTGKVLIFEGLIFFWLYTVGRKDSKTFIKSLPAFLRIHLLTVY